MVKNREINGTEEIALVTPNPDAIHLIFIHRQEPNSFISATRKNSIFYLP